MKIPVWALAAGLAAMISTPAIAQDAESSVEIAPDLANLVGHWTGTITEPGPGPQLYTLSVRIGIDRTGRPVGDVQYDAFPCSGVWSNFSRVDGALRFDETITNGEQICAPRTLIELRPNASGLALRVWSEGYEDQAGAGLLERRPE